MFGPPPSAPLGHPVLPPGWSEHIGPAGQVYYYNALTRESTYVRPLPLPFIPPNQAQNMYAPAKKEKPLYKASIPGTDWLRIKTTEGNVFYSHKSRKESVWMVPDEIEDALKQLEQDERNKEEQSKAHPEPEGTRGEAMDERIKETVKRKAEEAVPVEEVVITKKPRTDDSISSEESEDDTSGGESEDDEWQREAAKQLAAEAEEQKRKVEKQRQLEEAKKERETARAEEERTAERLQRQEPKQVDLSIEEAKALFKTMLREKEVNPLLPWDKSLPLFVSDPRYVLLSSVAVRREAFDEYCRERTRDLKLSSIKKEKETLSPRGEFEKLLLEEVKSTKTAWTDFRRAWKKDRRFYGWGRDDREREKRFREYIKELGEKKRAAAEKAEINFITLLKECIEPKDDLIWKDVKRGLYNDPRYDAVGSSSLREELFNTFLKGRLKHAPEQAARAEKSLPKSDTHNEEDEKRKRREQALKERVEKVKAERSRLDANIERSKQGMGKEEGERLFRTLLTDAIRDPQTWETALPQLKTDPRFINSPLTLNHQLQLFHAHIAHLRAKHLANLRALFQSHTPSLATSFSDSPVSSLRSSLPSTKLGYSITDLQHEFTKWQRERFQECRGAFDEMLGENSFVEFWGRLGKMGGEGVDGGVKVDEIGEGEGEGGGGTVDMKALAKNVDIHDMEKVIKNDKRYTVFDHIPEQREQWIRNYLAHLSAPKLSVHIPERITTNLIPLVNPLVVLQAGGVVRGSVMKLLPAFLLTLSIISSPCVQGDATRVKQEYQSDVARMRNIVINSLYSHKEIFLRELISNANDALEKLRLVSLTNKAAWNGNDPLNITINAIKDEDGKGGRIVITDTGIGMSADELKANLGTLAKSGTSNFLAQAENQDTVGTSNLIGAFGLGFYSSFLIANRVEVASVPAKSSKVPDPIQHVFISGAEDSTFEVYPDPRGNTLGRGTEITLYLKKDSLEYLEEINIEELVDKHSSYSSTFPIYLMTRKKNEVPDEDEETNIVDSDGEISKKLDVAGSDEEEAVVEDVLTDKEEKPEEGPKKVKTVEVEEWLRLNSQPPLWTRDPKNVTDDEYKAFYRSFFKDHSEPLGWTHFTGDSESGVSFKAMVFLPAKIEEAFWQNPLLWKPVDIKLMVKRVFITSEFGDDSLPKWASWAKVVVDAEDLQLNVSRETLQSSRFLKQMRTIILKRLIQLFNKLVIEDPEKFKRVEDAYNPIFKLGAVEDMKNRDKLIPLIRFATNQRNASTLDEYLENKKKGQKQIFYIAEIGKTPEDLAQSVFIEKLHARGYEVLLFTEPLDEILVQSARQWKKIPFQDVAKAGLKFGDEDMEAEEEKEQQKLLSEKYKPLLDWLKRQSEGLVRDVVLSSRLVKSPCAIVADSFGYTANLQKMMSAANAQSSRSAATHEYALKAKVLEINPRSPLIEGLLQRIEELPIEPDERDESAEAELNEVTSILIDSALVRSGFEVQNSNVFFNRMDRVLRRSLGVSETAPTDETVKPAPPVDPELPSEESTQSPLTFPDVGDDQPRVVIPDNMKDQLHIELDEMEDDISLGYGHDEL
ncbi:hypothetical protein AX15_002109 [Amanita polypyramis BW_CC]|nr:hypothetical protein AX15_002109 [Amanita polypyramis BW_CC]